MKNPRRTLAHLFSVGLLCAAAACADGQSSPSDSESTLTASPGEDALARSELDQRGFVLRSVVGSTVLAGASATLEFVRGELRFRAACNGSNSTYEIAGGHLQVSYIGSAQRACDQALLAQDKWLQDFLTSDPSIELSADELTLRSADTTLVFADRAVAEPAAQLVGKTFFFGYHRAQDDVGEPRESSISFEASGVLRFDTSCNTGTARYAASGDQLTFSEIGSTGTVCQGGVAITEGRLLDILRGLNVRFMLEGRLLTLTSGDKQLDGRY